MFFFPTRSATLSRLLWVLYPRSAPWSATLGTSPQVLPLVWVRHYCRHIVGQSAQAAAGPRMATCPGWQTWTCSHCAVSVTEQVAGRDLTLFATLTAFDIRTWPISHEDITLHTKNQLLTSRLSTVRALQTDRRDQRSYLSRIRRR